MTYPTPRHEHDCSGCTYLGHHDDQTGQYDLYFCTQGGNIPTVIARFGSDGPDYQSGLEFGKFGIIPSLTTAYQRAVEKGLVT